MIRRLRDWLHDVTARMMSRCRVCGSSANVLMYDPRGIWAYLIRQTWCPPDCPDHDYVHDRHERCHYCDNCGQEPPYDWCER